KPSVVSRSQGMLWGSAMHPRSKVGRSHTLMPKSDPKDLCPPAKYKPRRGARPLSAAEIKAAADRAEARSKLTAQYSATKRKTKQSPWQRGQPRKIRQGRTRPGRLLSGRRLELRWSSTLAARLFYDTTVSMSRQSVIPKKKRGPPPTGKG